MRQPAAHGTAKIFALTAAVMTAFAANSILNRFALAGNEIGPASFALIRVVAGAVTLAVLVAMRDRKLFNLGNINFGSVLALTVYLIGFSFAYISLDTGIGALILFGGVQVTMFAGALIGKDTITTKRWLGAALAFGGLVYLLAPSEFSPSLSGALLMTGAAIGWGVYSLIGRKATDPLGATRTNFVLAVPLVALALILFPGTTPASFQGISLAIISGAITSGLGYALWYAVLPKLDTVTASVAQLTVPLIALAGGILLLNEALTLRFIIATAAIMAGVIVSVRR